MILDYQVNFEKHDKEEVRMRFSLCLAYIVIFLLPALLTAQIRMQETSTYIEEVIQKIKTRNPEIIADLIEYPLNRRYPLPDIQDKADCLKRFAEVFDDTLLDRLSGSNVKKDWTKMGWKGYLFRSGETWLNEDLKIFAINYGTKAALVRREELIQKEQSFIHPSLKDYKEPIADFETETERIKIDRLGDNTYRYASWEKRADWSKKPAVIVEGGDWIPEGSGGNHRYVFTTSEYTYSIAVNRIGTEETPPAELTIYKNDVLIKREIVTQMHD